jgi:hypothetical protein
MDMPPAPPYATLYFGIHELKIVPFFAPLLHSYSHYLDDVIRAWSHNANPDIDQQNYLAFQASMNSFGLLTWELTPIANKFHFMDLMPNVAHQGIQTSLYKKEMNLYLYIPPHSAHAPGILPGFMFGMTACMF